MKKFFAIAFFISAMCGFIFAQSSFPEFEKARQIKLLKATNEDVLRAFEDYRTMAMSDSFVNTENANVVIFYSSGNCADDREEWNVSEGIVTEIRIHLKRVVKPKSLGLNFSGFKKERLYAQFSDSYVYHNKSLGIAVQVIDNEIESIILMPPRANYSKLCEDQATNKFYTSEKWFVDSKLKYRIREYNGFADVTTLDLSANEIHPVCTVESLAHACEMSVSSQIDVSVTAVDPENDPITYKYSVSGGKIIGSGSKVIWDLSGVKDGTYIIEAGADDGCGICGEIMKKTVIVKECPDCSVKDN